MDVRRLPDLTPDQVVRLQGVLREPVRNAAYRFNLPGSDRSPFRNVGKPGYEAEARELIRPAQDLRDEERRE